MTRWYRSEHGIHKDTYDRRARTGAIRCLTMMESALAAGASLVACAFALSTFERWLERRRRYELVWSAALALFAVGAAFLWVGASTGWTVPVFRGFYLFGAIVNVPVLALGTVYLLGRRRTGDRWAVAVAV